MYARLLQYLVSAGILLAANLSDHAVQAAKKNCHDLLNGSEDREKGDFFKNVAHGTHSLTVEDIGYFFNVIVPDDNGIPTVNINLSSPNIVLPNAPRAYPLDNVDKTSEYLSQTSCIRAMDRTVMLNHPDYVVRGPSMLEKIGHQFHMYELWVAVNKQVQTMSSTPDWAPNDDFCTCALDKKELFRALKMYSVKLKCKYAYDKRNGKGSSGEEECANWTPNEDSPISEGIFVNVLHEDDQLKSLWPGYVESHAGSMLNPAKIKDIANYMYCQLYKKGIV